MLHVSVSEGRRQALHIIVMSNTSTYLYKGKILPRTGLEGPEGE
jgi:hypothetical protein